MKLIFHTCLVSGDIKRNELPWLEAEIRDAIHCLDLQCIVGVGQEVDYIDGGLRQPHLLRAEPYPISTRFALTRLPCALPAEDVVSDVKPSSAVGGSDPLQIYRGPVHTRQSTHWSRRWS